MTTINTTATTATDNAEAIAAEWFAALGGRAFDGVTEITAADVGMYDDSIDEDIVDEVAAELHELIARDRLARIDQLTVAITARGAASTVWDNESAVDCDVFWAGERVGAATLLEADGRMSTWGSVHHWANDQLIRWLDMFGGDAGDMIAQLEGLIDAAVR